MKTGSKILAFQITGEFAHFRSPFVTSYLSTYPFPPKPTVLGILGAILGYPYQKVLTLQNHVKVAIKLNKPPRKALDYIRLWKFEDNNIIPSPIKMELLVNPDYTIFVTSEDIEFINELEMRLKNRDFVYPISLGKNEFVAFIWKVFSFNADEIEAVETMSINSILPTSIALPKMTTSNWATVGLVPVELELVPGTEGVRRVKRTETFAYSLNTKPIETNREISATKVGEWNIVMF